MDKFTLKADKYIKTVNEYKDPNITKMDSGVQNLATAAKLATTLGATPQTRLARRSGVKKLNKAMDGVLSKLADKINKMQAKIK